MTELYTDYRLGGIPRYYLAEREDNMLVPDEMRDCTAYVLCKTEKGMEILGTAFFVSVEHRKDGLTFHYAVTAGHVIVDAIKYSVDGNTCLRINTLDGGWDYFEIPVSYWDSHHEDSSVDVAVVNCIPPRNVFKYRTVPVAMFATEQIIIEENIGIGDEVFVTGLFINRVGQDRNLPIIRTGNIAAMPEEKIEVEHYGEIDAFLIESRSIGGLSGSPVFVHITKTIPRKEGGQVFPQNAIYLLGLMHGHWNLTLSDKDTKFFSHFQKEAINMGMAIAVPATKVLEVLRQPKYIQKELAIVAKEKRKMLPVADTARDLDEDIDTLPITRDDFMQILNQATRPVKPTKGTVKGPRKKS